jgi:hypothetical protein
VFVVDVLFVWNRKAHFLPTKLHLEMVLLGLINLGAQVFEQIDDLSKVDVHRDRVGEQLFECSAVFSINTH